MHVDPQLTHLESIAALAPGLLQGAGDFSRDLAAGSLRKTKAAQPAASRPTILVVDDQHMVADTTAEILARFGFHPVCAYNGRDALNLAEQLKPQYLLADVMMPEMNGVELAVAISRILPATRILLFSGQAGITDILRHAEDQGYVFELLAKPIHPEKLVEHLRKK